MIQMDEAYMRVEYMVQHGSSESLLNKIKVELAHCLHFNARSFLSSTRDPFTSMKGHWQKLQKAAWTKEEETLHRRRYLELCFHALIKGIITDNIPQRNCSCWMSSTWKIPTKWA